MHVKSVEFTKFRYRFFYILINPDFDHLDKDPNGFDFVLGLRQAALYIVFYLN